MILSPSQNPDLERSEKELLLLSEVYFNGAPLPPAFCEVCRRAVKPIGHGVHLRVLKGQNHEDRQKLWIYLSLWVFWQERGRGSQSTDGLILIDAQKFICGECLDSHMKSVHKLMIGEDFVPNPPAKF